MKLSPNPFDPAAYPERGVLYVRTDDGELVRANVAVGVLLIDLDEPARMIFTGTTLGSPKVIRTARQTAQNHPKNSP